MSFRLLNRKFLLLIFILFLFIVPKEVFATNGGTIIGTYSTTAEAYLYKCSYLGDKSCSMIETAPFTYGGIITTNLGQVSLTSKAWDLRLGFNVAQSFIYGNYYSITIYTGFTNSNDTAFYPLYSNGSDIGVGGTLVNAINTNSNRIASSTSTTNVLTYCDGGDYCSAISNVGVTTITFQAKDTGPWFTTQLYANNSLSGAKPYFLGYQIQYHGQSLDDVEANLSTQINTVQTTVDAVKEETEAIEYSVTSTSDDTASEDCGVICKLKSIWEGITSMLSYINPFSENFFAYKLIELLVDALKSLFIPDDMSFVTDFIDALEQKLGFIAAIPVQIIEFALDLVSASWSEFNSISLPSISIFGYNFWNAQEIDLTEAINIFKPFKYVTDVICVVLCARTLNKWREEFTGGGSQ